MIDRKNDFINPTNKSYVATQDCVYLTCIISLHNYLGTEGHSTETQGVTDRVKPNLAVPSLPD